MTKNVGSADKIVRYVLAIGILALILTDVVVGTMAWVLGALAVIFAATALINWCPIWAAFGVNTTKKTS